MQRIKFRVSDSRVIVPEETKENMPYEAGPPCRSPAPRSGTGSRYYSASPKDRARSFSGTPSIRESLVPLRRWTLALFPHHKDIGPSPSPEFLLRHRGNCSSSAVNAFAAASWYRSSSEGPSARSAAIRWMIWRNQRRSSSVNGLSSRRSACR